MILDILNHVLVKDWNAILELVVLKKIYLKVHPVFLDDLLPGFQNTSGFEERAKSRTNRF